MNGFVKFCGWMGEYIVRKDDIVGLCDGRVSKDVEDCDNTIEAKVMLRTGERLSITMGITSKEIKQLTANDGILDYFLELLGLAPEADDATSE